MAINLRPTSVLFTCDHPGCTSMLVTGYDWGEFATAGAARLRMRACGCPYDEVREIPRKPGKKKGR